MKIAAWNLERLVKNKNHPIIDKISEVNPDILTLTETNSIIYPDNYTCVSTEILPPVYDGIKYKAGENRTSIFTKYKTGIQYKTTDGFTSVCTDIETPFGIITVYGTIIGVFGGRGQRFQTDLNQNLQDFEKLFTNKQICIAGDFNVAFTGYPYPSHKARQTLNEVFKKYNLTNVTEKITDNVDHIILSNDFIKNKTVKIETWNEDKKLSDHIGICVQLSEAQ
ncbi:MAG: Endonuclease/Exonuclease/phosphatase family protein [Bacteroidota bacterium]|nr:Endonuclease/Exonuclease/phosphatase family protein [Bacteroidota bacterium]